MTSTTGPRNRETPAFTRGWLAIRVFLSGEAAGFQPAVGHRPPRRLRLNGGGFEPSPMKTVKRSAPLRHLRLHGCILKREGRSHPPWSNPANGAVEAVPRHVEIPNRLARKICSGLGIPEIG